MYQEESIKTKCTHELFNVYASYTLFKILNCPIDKKKSGHENKTPRFDNLVPSNNISAI